MTLTCDSKIYEVLFSFKRKGHGAFFELPSVFVVHFPILYVKLHVCIIVLYLEAFTIVKWKIDSCETFLQIEKLRKLRQTRPLVVTFTGMILSSMNGGHVSDCVSIFEHCRTLVAPDIGIINAMLKVYGQNDMFLKAKELFEETKKHDSVSEINENGHRSSPKPDAYTFSSMLEASASALQWEYFEYVYKEMILSGYQLFRSKHDKLLVQASRAGKVKSVRFAVLLKPVTPYYFKCYY